MPTTQKKNLCWYFTCNVFSVQDFSIDNVRLNNFSTLFVFSFHDIRFVDTGEMPDTFPYRTKALFAFEEIDGVDVCFFGMHVQEYGSECPFPNTRLVRSSQLQ